MLSEEEILNIYEEHPKSMWGHIRSADSETYEYLENNFEGKYYEKVYKYLYGVEESYCNIENCGGDCGFDSFKEGYKKYCSYECAGIARSNRAKETRECEMCTSSFQEYKKRDRRFCSHKCRVRYQNTEEWSEKMKKSQKKTLQDEYGVNHPSQIESTIESLRETMNEKYGGIGFASDVIKEKTIQTKKERYDDKNIEVTKMKETMVDKYGVENASKLDWVMDKKKNEYMKKIDNEILPDHIDRSFSLDNYNGVVDGSGKSIFYDFLCKECNDEFIDMLNNGNTPQCPNCDKERSQPEKELYCFVRGILPDDIKIIRNDRSTLGDNRELDIYIPEKEIAIEFNGIQWHSQHFGDKHKKYHLNKTRDCESRGIHLIQIFGHEWADKREIVKDRLKYILDVSDKNRIYARECEVAEVETSIKTDFFNKYHIQGPSRSSVKLGLYYDRVLVSMMTFGKRSVFQNVDGKEWEIKRFASSDIVVGGASKLFADFIRNHKVDKIVSFADRRWTTKVGKSVYDHMGFDLVKETEPNYWYFHKTNPHKLTHRFGFRKDQLEKKLETFDPEMTEWENMRANGYDRIWDCGNLKYELNP